MGWCLVPSLSLRICLTGVGIDVLMIPPLPDHFYKDDHGTYHDEELI